MADLAQESWKAANEPAGQGQKLGSTVLFKSWYGRAAWFGLAIYLAMAAIVGMPWALIFFVAWFPVSRILNRKATEEILAKRHRQSKEADPRWECS